MLVQLVRCQMQDNIDVLCVPTTGSGSLVAAIRTFHYLFQLLPSDKTRSQGLTVVITAGIHGHKHKSNSGYHQTGYHACGAQNTKKRHGSGV